MPLLQEERQTPAQVRSFFSALPGWLLTWRLTWRLSSLTPLPISETLQVQRACAAPRAGASSAPAKESAWSCASDMP